MPARRDPQKRVFALLQCQTWLSGPQRYRTWVPLTSPRKVCQNDQRALRQRHRRLPQPLRRQCLQPSYAPTHLTRRPYRPRNAPAANAAACTGFQQLKVKVWLRSGIQIALMFCCSANAAIAPASGRHPACFRINHEGRCGERNAIGHTSPRFMQTKNPGLARKNGRQWKLAELQYRQGQCAAEQRGIDRIIEKMIKAEPQCSRCCKLCIATADPAT